MKTIESTWNPQTKILTTKYKGTLSADDAVVWEKNLNRALSQITVGTQFKLLLDLHGFEPENLVAHKAMRNIIPLFLANHGLRPAFIDLFDEKPELPISAKDGRTCVAFANVHHEENKMADYQKRIGRTEQQFFIDFDKAQRWLLAL